MTSNNFKLLLIELNKYRNKNKEKILQDCIQARLDKSLKEYYNELNKAFEHLEDYNERNNIKMMKKINKEY